MTDSLLPKAPSMDEPLEMLEACHDRIEAQLKTLERLLAYLPEHGADQHARKAAQAILQYFNTAGPNHHEDEERDLFPKLLVRAASDEAEAVRSLVSELLADHAQMASALDVVRRQLQPVAEGTVSTLEAAPVQLCASLYRQHIEKENSRLLPLARRLLGAEDIDTLSRAMTARRRP